ncbi:MAG: UDP-N-acetylglucosamine 2-epimerase [Saprospiraceae bacterium]
MNRRKIAIVTGTRAEFGLLYWLMREIAADDALELQIIATGMHLSPEFGLTYKTIEDSGFQIAKKVEILLSSDTPVGIAKSMGLGLIAFAEAFTELNPAMIVLLGDRFELLAAASAATVCRIPIAHIHGGETTEGAVDEAFRHAITKMSYLHFTATDTYRNRVIQLGEHPDRVFNTGAPGLDNIAKLNLLSKRELEQVLDFQFGQQNLLVTFHPVTLENASAEGQFSALLQALDELENTKIIFTLPNADTEGRIIIKLIQDYVAQHAVKAKAFISLGQLNYLSTLQYIDAVVGNSSSGLLEAPSFKIATVNIGDRQKGRILAESVISCAPEYAAIRAAIAKALSLDFKQQLAQVENPYGQAGASLRIKNILKSIDLRKGLKKTFYDLSNKV